MAKTRRSEQKGFITKSTPSLGTKLYAYTYRPTDGFIQNVMVSKILDDDFKAFQADADSVTDEYYRRTRVTRKTSIEDGVQERRNSLSLARQIATKNDQEAVIRLMARDRNYRADQSKGAKKANPLKNVIPPYTKFFLESVSESRVEKAQVIETFGEFVAFFFGRRPEVYQFGGRLLNTKIHDWKNDFQEVYDNFLRGTKAVENGATVFIQYDDVVAEGFLMNCNVEYSGIANNECPFNFSMIVTNRAPINQLARLRERRSRGIFSDAEQQLLNSLESLRTADNKTPFVLMHQILSGHGSNASDAAVVNRQNNALIVGNMDLDTVLSSIRENLPPDEERDAVSAARAVQDAKDVGVSDIDTALSNVTEE